MMSAMLHEELLEGVAQGGYTILLCALIGYWFDDTTNQKTVQNKDDQIPNSDWFREIRTIKIFNNKVKSCAVPGVAKQIVVREVM